MSKTQQTDAADSADSVEMQVEAGTENHARLKDVTDLFVTVDRSLVNLRKIKRDRNFQGCVFAVLSACAGIIKLVGERTRFETLPINTVYELDIETATPQFFRT